MVLSVNSCGVERREGSGEREGGRKGGGRKQERCKGDAGLPPSLSGLHLFGPWLQTPQGRSLGNAPFTSRVPRSDLLPPMGESLLFLEVGGTTVGPHPR